MRRRRERPSPPVRDPHEEPTRVLAALRPCPMCKGSGYLLGMVDPADLAVPCGCAAGSRLRCALPESTEPYPGRLARVTAERLGLPSGAAP